MTKAMKSLMAIGAKIAIVSNESGVSDGVTLVIDRDPIDVIEYEVYHATKYDPVKGLGAGRVVGFAVTEPDRYGLVGFISSGEIDIPADMVRNYPHFGF